MFLKIVVLNKWSVLTDHFYLDVEMIILLNLFYQVIYGQGLYSFIKVFFFIKPCNNSVCLFLYKPFCDGALKLDMSSLFTTFFL